MEGLVRENRLFPTISLSSSAIPPWSHQPELGTGIGIREATQVCKIVRSYEIDHDPSNLACVTKRGKRMKEIKSTEINSCIYLIICQFHSKEWAKLHANWSGTCLKEKKKDINLCRLNFYLDWGILYCCWGMET